MFCFTPEEKQEACTVSVSRTLSDSLVYGADWSWLYFSNLSQTCQSCCSGSFPCSNSGVRAAHPCNLKAVRQLPAPSHHLVEDEEEGHPALQSGNKLRTTLQPLTEDTMRSGGRQHTAGTTVSDCDLSLEAANLDIAPPCLCSLSAPFMITFFTSGSGRATELGKSLVGLTS